MKAISLDEVYKRAAESNKTLICEVEKNYGKRHFSIICNFCSTKKNSTLKDFKKCKVCSDNLRSKNLHNFIDDAKKIHSDKYNYDLVEYVNSYSKVEIKCNECNNVFFQQPSQHILGRGCSICSKNKKLDTAEFIFRSKQIHGNKYNYDLVKYINSQSKVQIKCNQCKNMFYQSAGDHMRGSGCYVCSCNSRKTSIEDFICKAKKIHDDKYNYDLVEYVNKRTKVKIICNDCNNVFLQTPGSHLQGRGCPNCQIIKSKDSLESFIIKAKSVHKDRYDYNSVRYINSVNKVKIFCIECNDFFEQRPGDHLQGIGCRKCAIKYVSEQHRSNTEEFILKAKQKHGNKYNYDLVEYINVLTKVKISCNKCKNLFEQNPSNHLNGQGCPKCNESKGELYLKKILRENNIEFIPQHTFPGLKYINTLRCDIYIPNVNLVIEVDGDGHRKAIFGSTPEEKQKSLEDIVRNDAIKNKYCEDHKINICRIPYSISDKDLSFIGEIAMNCYNELRIKCNTNMLDFNNKEKVNVL